MPENNQDKKALQQFFSAVWWLVLLRGIAVFILGLLLLFRPGATILLFVQFLGAYWMVDGIFTLINSIKGRKTSPNWGWGIFVGILGIIAGLVVFSRPLATAILTIGLLVYFLAFMAIVTGVSSIITGIRLRKEISKEWSMILSGVLWTIFGILLFSSPAMATATLVWMTGVFALGGGIVIIIASFRMKKFGKG
jgi:uncharacterized membrane protein HdeD (DUF308 family)